jgi:hypothetical protein
METTKRRKITQVWNKFDPNVWVAAVFTVAQKELRAQQEVGVRWEECGI